MLVFQISIYRIMAHYIEKTGKYIQLELIMLPCSNAGIIDHKGVLIIKASKWTKPTAQIFNQLQTQNV